MDSGQAFPNAFPNMVDLLLDFAQSYEKGLVVDSEMGVCVFIPPLAHWMQLSSHESLCWQCDG